MSRPRPELVALAAVCALAIAGTIWEVQDAWRANRVRVLDDDGLTAEGALDLPLDPRARDVPGCAPAPEDGRCTACAKKHCCELSLRCFADTACDCFADCEEHGRGVAGVEACRDRCGVTDNAYEALVACLDAQCAKRCPVTDGGAGGAGGSP
jgi:hypothetical protein